VWAGVFFRYIVSVSYFKDNLFVRAFHPPTKFTLPFMIQMKQVLTIFGVAPDTHPQFYPGILHPDNRQQLGEWLALELSLCQGYLCQIPTHAALHGLGKPALMLEIIEVRRGTFGPPRVFVFSIDLGSPGLLRVKRSFERHVRLSFSAGFVVSLLRNWPGTSYSGLWIRTTIAKRGKSFTLTAC
jgi:hypothetical protein